jgi:starch-binding outer membrane protein SusE/F
MKNNFKILLAAVVLLTAFSCKKETNPFFANGHAVTLTTTTSATIAPPVADSLNKVLFLSWTNPSYSTDSAHQKFLVELDSASSFNNAVSFEVDGPFTDSLTAEQINNVLLGFGFAFNTPYTVYVRVVSSYANNNEQYSSNMLTFTMSAYKTPPKVQPVATALFIVGDAVGTAPGTGWNNPVNAPYQQLTQIDSVTFGGIFDMAPFPASFLLLPFNGNWNYKYALQNSASAASTGGSFGYYSADTNTVYTNNIPGPAAAGWYQLTVNFQTGLYTLVPFTGQSLPDALDAYAASFTPPLTTGLWIIGDATSETNEWDNDPVALANQQFTRLSNADYQLTTTLNNTGGFLFLPVAGDWGNKYASNVTPGPLGGAFVFNGSNNFPAPATAGSYLIDVNFLTGNYTLTPQ